MSAKLLVHKFEPSLKFKSLQITINDGENGSNEVRYSEWFEGKTEQKKKDIEKSSRLIVKIISEHEFNYLKEHNELNLDSCAGEIQDSSNYDNTTIEPNSNFTGGSQNFTSFEGNDLDAIDQYRYSSYNNYNLTGTGPDNLNTNQAATCLQSRISINNTADDLSPLEYSLEKVKENNARIMENIHMLNRTLDYTKKKEILDVIAPKTVRYPCQTCGKYFVYEAGLKRHYAMRHAMTEMQPRWQIVWTCVECFQVWPQQEIALKHAKKCCRNNNGAECVLEIKTSSLLQCEFCEKVYTSIPRLLRHSKMHTTANNYECNACESTFESYKTAEQHWLLCPWLKMCYGFSLPKLLLCNACDRKFKNYEQLYNHRYKTDHFMAKTHHYSSGSLGILVYQCELCGRWFPSVLQLHNHRRQDHSIFESAMQFKGDNCKNYLDYYDTNECDYQVNPLENMHPQQYA